MVGGELERGRRSHREAEQMEGREAEGVGEREEVRDEVLVAQAAGDVVEGSAVGARVGDVAAERLREGRQLAAEVVAPQGRGAVEQDQWRPGAEHVIDDLEAIRVNAGLHAGPAAVGRGTLVCHGPSLRAATCRPPPMRPPRRAAARRQCGRRLPPGPQ